MKLFRWIKRENICKTSSSDKCVQLSLFDEILDEENDENRMDAENDGYITYYNYDGSFHSKMELTLDNVGDLIGFMVRCTMNNGDTYEGFSSPFRKYGEKDDNKENYDLLYLWTWDNLDEETHQLAGDEETKYNTTYTPVLIDEIKSIDAILFSHPRWGGRLHNRFFIDTSKCEIK